MSAQPHNNTPDISTIKQAALVSASAENAARTALDRNSFGGLMPRFLRDRLTPSVLLLFLSLQPASRAAEVVLNLSQPTADTLSPRRIPAVDVGEILPIDEDAPRPRLSTANTGSPLTRSVATQTSAASTADVATQASFI